LCGQEAALETMAANGTVLTRDELRAVEDALLLVLELP